MGIGDIEHIAVFRRQAAAGHGKLGGSDIRIAARRRIDHHIVDVLVGAGALGIAHISGNGAVFKGDGNLAMILTLKVFAASKDQKYKKETHLAFAKRETHCPDTERDVSQETIVPWSYCLFKLCR